MGKRWRAMSPARRVQLAFSGCAVLLSAASFVVHTVTFVHDSSDSVQLTKAGYHDVGSADETDFWLRVPVGWSMQVRSSGKDVCSYDGPNLATATYGDLADPRVNGHLELCASAEIGGEYRVYVVEDDMPPPLVELDGGADSSRHYAVELSKDFPGQRLEIIEARGTIADVSFDP
jgi:hypothetical protein